MAKASKKSAKSKEELKQAKPVDDKQTIDNHKQAAAHNTAAAMHHLDVVKHYEAGNFDKAARSMILAHGNHAIAGGFISDDAKHHAQTLKRANHIL